MTASTAVRIVDYEPAWPGLAEQELRRIKGALHGVPVRLEHVGSTAAPGLAAKPILDLQLSVDAIEPRERYVVALEGLGYRFVPAPESPDYHFFAKPPERPRTHHLHVGEAGEASTSSATSRFGTSCAATPTRLRATPRSSARSSRAIRRTASPTSTASTATSRRSNGAR